MKTLKSSSLAAALFLAPLAGQAATLSLLSSTTTVTAGSTFTVDLLIALDPNSELPNLVGSFDVDLQFSADKINLTNVLFGDKLGDSQTGEALADFTIGAGSANAFETSLLESNDQTCVFCAPPYLADLQTASFRLATFAFTANQAGVAEFGLTVNSFGDGAGNSLSTDISALPSVQVTAVPLPPAMVLFASALAFFKGRKQR